MAARFDLSANAHLLGDWDEGFDEFDELDLERTITFDRLSGSDVSYLIKKTSTARFDVTAGVDAFYEC